jgi:hypothetical protein
LHDLAALQGFEALLVFIVERHTVFQSVAFDQLIAF